MVSLGGSVAKSQALHAACANNVFEVVRSILEIYPSSINVKGFENLTPLMCAALCAAGRTSKNSIDETWVVDYLLAVGASKGTTDGNGLSAYGHLKKSMADSHIAMQDMMGHRTSLPRGANPTIQVLEAKLMPPGGPTTSDLSGGEGAEAGFVEFRAEDR